MTPTIKKLIAVALPAIALFSSCEKKFTIPLPKADYRPVLNTLMSQDSIIYVRVSISNRPETGYILEVDEATVQLYEDDVLKETLSPEEINGKIYYISQGRVAAGHRYRVTAQVPDYALAEGTDIIPDRNTFTVSDKKSFTTLNSDGYPEPNISFTLQHNGSGKGYYQYRVYAYRREVATISGTDTTWREVRDLSNFYDKNENDLFDGDNYTSQTGNLPEKRVLDPGQSASVSLVSSDGMDYEIDSFQVEVTQLTEVSGKYLQSLRTAINTDGDPTSEKPIMYGNIKNGFGIVGGMATKAEMFAKP